MSMRAKIYVKNLLGDCRGCPNLEWSGGPHDRIARCQLFPPYKGPTGRELDPKDTKFGETYPVIPEWCPLPDGADHEREVRHG